MLPSAAGSAYAGVHAHVLHPLVVGQAEQGRKCRSNRYKLLIDSEWKTQRKERVGGLSQRTEAKGRDVHAWWDARTHTHSNMDELWLTSCKKTKCADLTEHVCFPSLAYRTVVHIHVFLSCVTVSIHFYSSADTDWFVAGPGMMTF